MYYLDGQYQFPTDEQYQVSEAAKNLIRKCLEVDPSRRYFFFWGGGTLRKKKKKKRIKIEQFLGDPWFHKDTPLSKFSLRTPAVLAGGMKDYFSVALHVERNMVTEDVSTSELPIQIEERPSKLNMDIGQSRLMKKRRKEEKKKRRRKEKKKRKEEKKVEKKKRLEWHEKGGWE